MFSFNKKQTKTDIPQIDIPRVLIQEDVVARTKGLLLSYSQPGDYHEGIVYWAGKNIPEGIIILAALTPKAKTTFGSVQVGIVENAQIVREINNLGLQLVAQVHSHPFDCGVGHSLGDNDMAFMPFEGFLSIVVKDFALDGVLPLYRNGIHVFHNGQFVRLQDKQISEHFVIIPTHIETRM